MGTIEKTGAQVELEVDLTTGSAVVDGGRIELPPKEFALLAHLAAHPGKAISRAELIEAIWPETPLMTDQDLYWHVNRLRKRIGDKEREDKLIANRPRFGYFLNLPEDRVKIAGSASGADPVLEVDAPSESEPITETIVLDERPVPLIALDEEQPPRESPLPRSLSPRRSLIPGRRTMAALATVLIVALMATAWSVTRQPAPKPDVPDRVARTPQGDPATEAGSSDRGKTGSRPHTRKRKGQAGSTSEDQVVAAPAPAVEDEGTTTSETAPTGSTRSTEQLPPPPTRFLYHLVNQETGDHFVTTDPAASSAREAAGYVGGAIARVYTEKQPGTKAISTNSGRAYIFIDADARTSPRTDTAPLWFVSDGAGDFFYVTDQADVPQGGWSASLIGYVGAQ